MAHPSTYYDLLEAFRQESCPVCRVAQHNVERYLATLAYECVNDLGVREQLRASNGFCRSHAAEWLEQPRLLGTAIIYRDIISNLSVKLRRLRERPPVGISISTGDGDPLGTTGECPVCSFLASEEQKLLGSLLDSMYEREFEDAYARSAGLCLPHLRAALAAAPDEATRDTLLEVSIGRQEVLRRQLDEIIRRFDPSVHGEPPGEERGAASRAIWYVTGTTVSASGPQVHIRLPVGEIAAGASLLAAGGYALYRRYRQLRHHGRTA